MVTEKVIDALNKDENAKKLLAELNDTAKRMGLSADSAEYKEMREMVLLLALMNNEEAKRIMFEEAYNKANGLS